MILLGIDPGKNTGFASWDTDKRAFLDVTCLLIHQALTSVNNVWDLNKHKGDPGLFVIFEDCRQHKMYGGANERAGAAVMQGVGSVKRDCTIWEDFLIDRGIPHLAQPPLRRGTKWTAQYFRLTTGWQQRTNSHGRDAGVLVYGMNDGLVQRFTREWQHRTSHANAPAHA